MRAWPVPVKNPFRADGMEGGGGGWNERRMKGGVDR